MISETIFNIDGEYHHILREIMRNDLIQPKYEGFVRMYRQLDKNFINEMKSEYYLHLEKVRKMIPFPEWFINKHCGEFYFEFLEKYGYTDDNIYILEEFSRKWKTKEGLIFNNIHPPSVSIAMEYGSNSAGEPITFDATAFILPVGDKGNDKIIKQNNWTNLNLRTISHQLTRVEENITLLEEKVSFKEKDKESPL